MATGEPVTLAHRARAAGVRLRLAWEARLPGPRALILLYHRIANSPTDPFGMCTPPGDFERHLELLRRHARPVPLRDLLSRPEAGAVAITFDDGYPDNLTHAAPRLGDLAIPATFFVTAEPGRREFWWDELDRGLLQADRNPPEDFALHRRWRCWQRPPTAAARRYVREYQRLSRLPLAHHPPPGEPRPLHVPLSLAQIGELAAHSGMEIGCHTLAHERLPLLAPSEQRQDVARARRILETHLGRAVTSFAYPFGAQTRATVQAVRAAGFACACSASPGFLRAGADRWHLPRITADGMPCDQMEELLRRLSR